LRIWLIGSQGSMACWVVGLNALRRRHTVPSPGMGASSERPLYDIRELWEVHHAIIHQ